MLSSELHMKWGKWARKYIGPYERPPPEDRDRNRVLRIGYLSGDLCEHVVADCFEVRKKHAINVWPRPSKRACVDDDIEMFYAKIQSGRAYSEVTTEQMCTSHAIRCNHKQTKGQIA